MCGIWEGRDHLKKEAPELWKDYKKATSKQKAEWAKTWDETGDFSHIQTRKTESKEKQTWQDDIGQWRSGHASNVQAHPPASRTP